MIDRSRIERFESRLEQVETELARESASGHSDTLRGLMQEHTFLKRIHERAEAYFQGVKDREESKALLDSKDTDADLRELAEEEYRQAEERLPGLEKELMISLLPPHLTESRNTIMEIRAGTGGDEAALFAGDLFRMYSRYADTHGWKIGMIDTSASNVGGFKEVVFSIEGTDVYKFLQYESGVHRVQRIPVTESSGRIHTSAATVAVLPEADEIDDIPIKQEELRIDVYRSSGPGGQSVNTTDSAVRITHLPTGIKVQCQDEKSQHRNKDKAMRVLKARLLDHVRSEEGTRTADARRSQIGSGDRSERIRTYNFPQNRLTDHRINFSLHSLDRVMEGELDALLQALYEHDVQMRLEKQLS